VVKVLSKSGDSLADVYDVVGSIAGIDQLHSEEISLVHEMGSTIFSERLSGAVRRATTGNLLQDVDFNVVIDTLPAGITRMSGVLVFTDNATRILRVCVSQRDVVSARDIPVWIWDGANFQNANFEDDGAGVATHSVLTPEPGTSLHQSLIIGTHQPQEVADVALRGRTTGFGAGNVDVTVLFLLAFTALGGGQVSNRGLHVPSW